MRAMPGQVATVMLLVVTACRGNSTAPTVSTPTLTPTATPTPTPTPSPSYDSAADFTCDRSFTAFGATQTSVEQQSDAIGFDFIAATRSYRLRYRDAMLTVNGAALPTDATIGYGRDLYVDDQVRFGRSGFANTLLDAGYLFWSAPDSDGVFRERRLIFGARTVASDLPTSGSISYQAAIKIPSLFNYPDPVDRYGGERFPATVTIDWGSRIVSADFAVSRQGIGSAGSSLQPPIDMILRGTIDGSGRITGTLAARDASPAMIEGAVFGPRAVEIGILSASDGTLLGRQ